MEDFTAQTPLTVGSPQEVIERYAGFREWAGDYQRQLFLMDHAGLPLKTVLEQIDILGEQVVPELRKEFAADRPADIPEAPTHEWLVARQRAGNAPVPRRCSRHPRARGPPRRPGSRAREGRLRLQVIEPPHVIPERISP